MGTTLAEPVAKPRRLSFKAAAADVEAPGTVEVREDEGIVEAIVSVTGIEDEVKDIIEPGAYAETLTKRRPKVIWHHSWEKPIGRVLHVEELLPGDPRLPAQTKDGQPWPNKAGGLLATMQFNLKSDRGREAFEAVRFYSETGECEWSIGYQVPEGKATRDKRGIRHIKALDVYEFSFVLFGAASQTGTLGVKAAVKAAEYRLEQKTSTGKDPGPKAAVTAVVPGSTSVRADPDPNQDENPANDEPEREPDGEDEAAVDTEVAIALAHALTEWTDEEWEALAGSGDAADVGKPAANPKPAQVRGKAITPGGRVGDDSPVGEPGGRQNWVDKAGGLPRYIRMVAHALIRKGMSESRAIATAVNTMKRWAAGGNNVSAKVQAPAAKALAEWEAKKAKGKALGFSSLDETQRALGYAPGGVLPRDRADTWDPWLERGQYASVKAVTPTSHHEFPRVEGTFEERIEQVRDAVIDALNETYEAEEGDDEDDEYGAATAVSSKPGCWSHISIEGTWPDRVIATCIKYGDGKGDRTESYEMNYTLAEDGEVTLSEPEPVKLSVVIESADGDESTDPETPVGDMLPVPEQVEAAVAGAKALLFAHHQQTKAGRVLSGVNEARLKGALESLIAILAAAGIQIDADAGRSGGVLPAQVDTGTTAPAAREGKVRVDADALHAELTSVFRD